MDLLIPSRASLRDTLPGSVENGIQGAERIAVKNGCAALAVTVATLFRGLRVAQGVPVARNCYFTVIRPREEAG